MSSGFRPNDQMHLPGLGVPIDPWTGELLQAGDDRAAASGSRKPSGIVRLILHELDGTTWARGPATAAWRGLHQAGRSGDVGLGGGAGSSRRLRCRSMYFMGAG